MNKEALEFLQKLRLLQDAPDDILEKIATHTQTRRLEKDDVLIHEGDASHSLFVIRSGWVKVVAQDHTGWEITLNQCGPGQIIGEMSLIDQQARSNTVIALSPAIAYEIDYETVVEVLRGHPQLVKNFLHDLTKRIRFANVYISEAAEWCQQIADGNYDFVQEQVHRTKATIVDTTHSPAVRASAFLSAFFKMVEGVKKREETLKNQIRKLKIEIDEAKRQTAVQEITNSDFFTELQASARAMRARRQSQLKSPSETKDDVPDEEQS